MGRESPPGDPHPNHPTRPTSNVSNMNPGCYGHTTGRLQISDVLRVRSFDSGLRGSLSQLPNLGTIGLVSVFFIIIVS